MSAPREKVEEVILGAVLDAEGPALKTAAGLLMDLSGLRAEDFGSARVRVAWAIAERLATRNRPVDASTIFAAGVTAKAFNGEDREWLAALQAGNSLDRERFAEVCDTARLGRRREKVLASLRSVLDALAAPEAKLDDAVSPLEDVLQEIAGAVSTDGDGSEDLLAISADWEAAERDPAARPVLVPTGIDALDQVIAGLPPNLSIICGLPSVGKSALLASIIDGQLRRGLRVGLFGLEDGTRWVAKRLLARDLQMPVRDVGWTKREGERATAYPDVAAAIFERLKRLIVFRHDSVRTDELLRRATAWKQRHAIDVLFIDHGGEVDHASDRFDEYRLKVAESYRKIRNWAVRTQTPAVVLTHTARPPDDNEERPPRITEIAESSYIERRARLVLGVWAKRSEPEWMRCTVLKQTEGARHATVRLPRHVQAGLISEVGGELVNLDRERAEEIRVAKAKRLDDAAAAREVAKKLAEERKPKPAQQRMEGT